MALHPPSAIAPGGLRASKSFPTAGDVRSPFSLIFRRPQQQNRSLSDSKSMMTASPYLKAVSGVFSTSSSRNAARDNKKPPLCRSVVSCLLRRPHDLVHSLPCGLMASVYPFNRSVPCLWRHYFQIIFVMDNNGREPVVEARDELHRMLNELSYGDRMSFVMLCFWCSQTNKIFPMT